MLKYKTIKPEVISHYKETGHTPAQMSRIFKIPRKTIHDWILEIKNDGVDKIIEDNKKYIKHRPFGDYKFGQKLDSDFGPGGHAELDLNKGITKTVILSDIHLPYNIDLNPVFHFIADFKTDYVILNGDTADMDCFSPHDMKCTNYPLPFSEQKNLCLNLISELEKVCKKIVWIQGNHEDWSRQAAMRNPALAGTVETHNWLPKSIIYVPLNHCAKLGKLRVLHGNSLRNERCAMPTRNMLQQWSDGHLLFGHYHRREAFTQVSEIGSIKRHAEMSACLCSINPAYSRNSPNAVTNGFAYTISEKDGNYWPVFPSIVHGKFIAEGKLYV